MGLFMHIISKRQQQNLLDIHNLDLKINWNTVVRVQREWLDQEKWNSDGGKKCIFLAMRTAHSGSAAKEKLNRLHFLLVYAHCAHIMFCFLVWPSLVADPYTIHSPHIHSPVCNVACIKFMTLILGISF